MKKAYIVLGLSARLTSRTGETLPEQPSGGRMDQWRSRGCESCVFHVYRQRQKAEVVWGPSARLLAGDKDLQAKIKGMLDDGVKIQACLACTDSYGVTEQLRKMGIEVKYMGKPFTDLIQQNWHVLTF